MRTSPSAAVTSPWLVSARFDLAVFVAPALASLAVAAASGVLADSGNETPLWAWLLWVVGVDVAHVHGTTLRVYLDAHELRRRRMLYTLVPALGFAVAAAAYATGYFWRTLAYLAVFHFMRQQIGWARLYRKRAGEHSRFDANLDEATLYAAMLYPLIVWHTRMPAEFHWFLPGDFAPGLPGVAARYALLPWAALLALFCARQLQLALTQGRVHWGKLLLVTTTAATWYGGIVYFANDFAFTVTNVIAHGVPYMAMSYRVNRRTRSSAFAPLRSFALYAAALCTLAFLEEWLWDAGVWRDRPELFPAPTWNTAALAGWLVPLLALPQIVHYILDAYLWRLDGKNPRLAEALGVSAPAAEE